MNRTSNFQGMERRTGFERRAEAPKQQANQGPRILRSISIGEETFGPGHEKRLHEYVQQENERIRARNTARAAKGEQPEAEVDLARLEARGAIKGFAEAERILAMQRNRQQVPGEDRVEGYEPQEHDWPGRRPLAEVAPMPAEAGSPHFTAFAGGELSAAQRGAAEEGDVAAEVGGGRDTGRSRARTGGAARPRSKGPKARGERSGS